MSDLMAPEQALLQSPRRLSPFGATAIGVAYWAAILLALEPGNLLRAVEVGQPLPIGPEVARIAGASLLGSASAPAVLLMVRHFPVGGVKRWRNAAAQAFSVAGLTVGLIVVSCILAGLGPFNGSTDVPRQLAENGPLVAFCLVGLVAGAHAVRFPRQAAQTTRAKSEPGYLAEIRVSTRGGSLLVPLHEVDWIETQGNYLALHAGSAVHLIRETSTRLEQQLDPERFARVHRRTLVAVDRVRELKPLRGGDAELRLVDGTRLRLSRSYRDLVRTRLQDAMPDSLRP